jgi:rRNA-processing protein FCF1
MSGDLLRSLSRYLGQGLLLDANILLVFAVGLFDPLLIARHKRTRENYNPEDFELTEEIIELFHPAPRFSTPQLLTEVSNLLAQSQDTLSRLLFVRLAEVIAIHEEHYMPSSRLAAHGQFATLGRRDIAVLELASQKRAVVVTDDSRFADYLGRNRVDVVKFRDLKKLDDV